METLLHDKVQLDAIRDDPSTPDQLREARKVITEIEKGRTAITIQSKIADGCKLELLHELDNAKEIIRNINIKEENIPVTPLVDAETVQPVSSSDGTPKKERKTSRRSSQRSIAVNIIHTS